MRKLLSGLVIAAAMLCAALTAPAMPGADDIPGTALGDYCINPAADSVSMAELRAYLDSIRLNVQLWPSY